MLQTQGSRINGDPAPRLRHAGMLYTLTRRLFEMGLSVHSAKIASWGHKIRDVFYLTDSTGQRPTEEVLDRLQTGR